MRIPQSVVAAITHDIFINGCQINFGLDKTTDVEVCSLYPGTSFRTIEECFDDFAKKISDNEKAVTKPVTASNTDIFVPTAKPQALAITSGMHMRNISPYLIFWTIIQRLLFVERDYWLLVICGQTIYYLRVRYISSYILYLRNFTVNKISKPINLNKKTCPSQLESEINYYYKNSITQIQVDLKQSEPKWPKNLKKLI